MSFIEKTWRDVFNDESITCIEDFRVEQVMGKDAFQASYKEMCDELTGETEADQVSFFQTRDVLNPMKLVVRDEDARADLDDWAVELGCIPSLGEHQRGETDAEKRARENKERQKKLSEERRLAKQEAATPQKLRETMMMGMVALEEKISKEENETKRGKLMAKLERLKEKLNSLKED